MLHPVITSAGWELLVAIKERFRIRSGGGVRRAGGAEIRFEDEPWSPDAPDGSSTKYPHDIAPSKPSTDVIVVGDAIVPGRGSARDLDVRVEVGDAARSLRVFGPRTWYDAGPELRPTDPLLFERAPLRWEHAFGGLDDSDPSGVLEEPRNPLGTGVVRDPEQLAGQPAPHVEDPEDPIRGHRSRPQPAGVGAIGPSFEPRRSAAGTYDERWIRQRMPLPPEDFDEHFHSCAAPGLRTRQHLVGGESVRLLGLHPDGPFSFELPRLSFLIEVPFPDGISELFPVLDTVLLEPNERQVELTWRACFEWPWSTGRKSTVRLTSMGAA
ncbi:MAG TPA: DUF2169 domain-containing protein [Sandaracinaceae bacterium LLY-WYZ-13_1]|nr:DUF2169 domain-containing protein [Sandaracinaceae bacterium LLY-WYZ-13_1]